MAPESRKLKSLKLTRKIELLDEVKSGDNKKTDKSKEFGILGAMLSGII
jgi:hypothetical protein